MTQGVARIVIIVGLVAVGAVVLAAGFDDTTTGAAPSGSPTASGSASPGASVSPTQPTPTPSPQTTGVIFMVLNGTNVTGLGAEAQQLLEADGYVSARAAENAPNPGVQRSTVYFRADDAAAQNQADAAYIAETYFPGAKVQELGSDFENVPARATVVVVVGQDFADAVAAT